MEKMEICMKNFLRFLISEYTTHNDPLLQYAKIEFKKDAWFVYNWMKNNPGKQFDYAKEAL